MLKKIALIDRNTRRRAHVSRVLSDFFFIDPYASLEELWGFWPREEMMLFAFDELSEGNEDSLEAVSAAMQLRGDWLPAVAYGKCPSPERVTDALHSGWLGYVDFPFMASSELKERLEVLSERGQRTFAQRKRRIEARRRIAKLTQRETQVLFELSKGASNKEIAGELQISPRTVEIHRANLFGKLNANSSISAARMAYDAEMLDDQETSQLVAATGHARNHL